MPAAVSVAGAAFTVSINAVAYECQISAGTVERTPTILRTKLLACTAYDQVDLMSSVSLDFLYDEADGMYEALQVSIDSATPVAVSIASTLGTWVSTAMYINSCNVSFAADGVASCTVGLEGEIAFS